MKVAITGVSGYLGGLLAPLLDVDPDVDSILGLDIVPPQFQSPKFSFQEADVRTAEFENLLRGADALYHLAFIVDPPKKMRIPAIDEINVQGSRRVFEGALAAGVPKIIYASSIAAYGAHPDNPEILTEDSPLRPNPDWYYSRNKAAVESLLDRLQQDHPDAIVVRFRPCVFVGPTIKNPVGKLLQSKVFFCLNKDIRLNLCLDRDIAEAFKLALRYGESNTFNLSGDDPLCSDEMAACLGKKVIHLRPGMLLPLLKAGIALGLAPEGMLDWFISLVRGSINASSEKAKAKLGWSPSFDTRGTLLQFVGQPDLPSQGGKRT